MKKPPENAEDGNKLEDSSSEVPIIQQFSEPESFISVVQVFKKIKLMITGDPITQNSSKAKTQELNHFINQASDSNNDLNTLDLSTDKFEQEQFSKSILSIWRTKAENAKEGNNYKSKDKLTNIYPITAAKKNDTPKA